MTQLKELGFHVKDYGDMEFDSVPNDNIGAGVKNPRTIGNAMHKVFSLPLSLVFLYKLVLYTRFCCTV